MRSVASNSWAASKKALLTIYKALIRPLFDYGVVAYDSASNSVKSKLDIIQAKALRICCAAISSSPTSAVLVEMGESPLQLRREQPQIQYAVKIKHYY